MKEAVVCHRETYTQVQNNSRKMANILCPHCGGWFRVCVEDTIGKEFACPTLPGSWTLQHGEAVSWTPEENKFFIRKAKPIEDLAAEYEDGNIR